MKLSQIFVYPIKSLGGITLQHALVCSYGLEHDRRWMLIDENSQMITQRECPRLAMLAPAIAEGGIRVTAPSGEAIAIPSSASESGGETATVDVFGHQYVGAVASAEINQAFADFTGMRCRLLSMRSDIFRTKTEVAFHDTSPVLVISQASLDDLNQRLATPLPMNRFRPNFVVEGATAYQEDGFGRFGAGDASFRAVKQCERCVIPTIDQAEGVFRGPEPLKTLATFRRKGQNVAFGSYYRPESAGAQVCVGEEVRLLEARTPARAEAPRSFSGG